MKKLIPLILAALLLTGCGSRPTPTPTATSAAPTPTAVPTAAPSPTPVPTPTAPRLPGAVEGGEHIIDVYVTGEERTVPMEVEDYLCGVVAGEMRSDWPLEALKAQAVVARTFLLYFLDKKGGSMYEGADISTDTAECQAYDAEGVNDRIREAVHATRGLALTSGGEYINAWFHSCSGGRTATAPEGLNYKGENPPYIRVVDSPEEDAPEEVARWEAAFAAEQVEAAMEELGVHSPLTSASIARRGASGRTTQLELGGRPVSAVELRMALDPRVFRSTLLTDVSLEDGYLILSGRGFGHGVGMSQWGAHTMANRGSSFEEILAHYYGGAQLVEAWD